MGWDKISILNGLDSNTSLIHAIKGSSEYVYGSGFGDYLRQNRFFSRYVIDADNPGLQANRWQIKPEPYEPIPIKLPDIAHIRYRPFPLLDGTVISDIQVFGGLFREISPRLPEDMIGHLAMHFYDNCTPNDAAEVWDFRQLPGKLLLGWG